MKEVTDSPDPDIQNDAETVEFEDFLDTGIIERIEVYSKNELNVCFQDGTLKKIDCSGRS